MPAVFIKSLTDLEELPQSHKPHIAMIGRSNVGKSSLINHLVQQKGLAYVSATPGRTQLINLFEIDRRFFLIDLPGYGYAVAPKAKRRGFAPMIHDYLTRAAQLKLVLLIIDASIPPMDIDADMMDFLQSEDIPFTIILNKIDKLSRNELAALKGTLSVRYPGISCIFHSNVSGKGRAEIWQAVEQTVKEAK